MGNFKTMTTSSDCCCMDRNVIDEGPGTPFFLRGTERFERSAIIIPVQFLACFSACFWK